MPASILLRSKRFHPGWNRVERSTIELPVFSVGDPDRTALAFQLGKYRTKFVCKLHGAVRGTVQILQDHTALVFVVFANDEIKGVVGHPKIPRFGLLAILRLIRMVPALQRERPLVIAAECCIWARRAGDKANGCITAKPGLGKWMLRIMSANGRSMIVAATYCVEPEFGHA
jgi:hypothetical protein